MLYSTTCSKLRFLFIWGLIFIKECTFLGSIIPESCDFLSPDFCATIDKRKENWIGSAATSKDYVVNEDILCGVQKVCFLLQRRVHDNKDQYENFRQIGII